MAWLYLIAAGITEIVWALGLKFSEGFSQPVPSVVTIIFIVISFLLFSKAMKTIPVGTSYAVFTGIGAAGTAVIGMMAFDESVNVGKIFFLLLLISGIIGLKLIDSEDEAREVES